jgi:hypothetical protein
MGGFRAFLMPERTSQIPLFSPAPVAVHNYSAVLRNRYFTHILLISTVFSNENNFCGKKIAIKCDKKENESRINPTRPLFSEPSIKEVDKFRKVFLTLTKTL